MFLTVVEKVGQTRYCYAYVNQAVASLEPDDSNIDWKGRDVGESCNLLEESSLQLLDYLLKADAYGFSVGELNLEFKNDRRVCLFLFTVKVLTNRSGEISSVHVPVKLKGNKQYLLSLGFDTSAAWGKISILSLLKNVNTKLLLVSMFVMLTLSQFTVDYIREFLNLPVIRLEQSAKEKK
jgi:hypothetical protein